MKGEGVGRKRRSTTTGSTLTRRCAPASPWQGEAFLCCFVGNSRQLSVRSLDGANPTGGQCRGDSVGRLLVPCTRSSGVAFCGVFVHDGARATHRVAPTLSSRCCFLSPEGTRSARFVQRTALDGAA